METLVLEQFTNFLLIVDSTDRSKKMNTLESLIDFLNKLEDRKIYYRLNKVRDSILVEVSVPGQRWEIEFMQDGTIQIEKFVSNGNIESQSELEVLFRDFSD